MGVDDFEYELEDIDGAITDFLRKKTKKLRFRNPFKKKRPRSYPVAFERQWASPSYKKAWSSKSAAFKYWSKAPTAQMSRRPQAKPTTKWTVKFNYQKSKSRSTFGVKGFDTRAEAQKWYDNMKAKYGRIPGSRFSLHAPTMTSVPTVTVTPAVYNPKTPGEPSAGVDSLVYVLGKKDGIPWGFSCPRSQAAECKKKFVASGGQWFIGSSKQPAGQTMVPYPGAALNTSEAAQMAAKKQFSLTPQSGVAASLEKMLSGTITIMGKPIEKKTLAMAGGAVVVAVVVVAMAARKKGDD